VALLYGQHAWVRPCMDLVAHMDLQPMDLALPRRLMSQARRANCLGRSALRRCANALHDTSLTPGPCKATEQQKLHQVMKKIVGRSVTRQ
jgi:hypothetical protein